MRKGYFLRLAIAFDQLLNVAFFNGNEDHTISGRVGYKALTAGAWYWIFAEKVINAIFFFDPDHCRNSIEWDEIDGC